MTTLDKYFLLKAAKDSKSDNNSSGSEKSDNSSKSSDSSSSTESTSSRDDAYKILSSRMADAYNLPRLKELPYQDTDFKVNFGFNDAYHPHMTDNDIMFPMKGIFNFVDYVRAPYKQANKYGIMVNPTDMASASILLGNAATRYKTNFHGNDYVSPFTKIMKEIGYTFTGLRRAKDYSDSWKKLKEIYKDHPDVLKDFAYLRDRAAQAQFKMDVADIIPRYGGGILGAYLMYKYGKPIKKYMLRKWPKTARIADFLGMGGGFLAGSVLSLLLTKSLRNGYNRQAASLREDPNYQYYNDRLQRRIKEIGREG